ncbi:MAG: sigma-54 dependent transcriptional regulator [Acidobacteriota bacterium]
MANLLIVDDEKGYREVLKVIFAADGHDVHTAVNGRAALEMLRSGNFDICVSDVKMPDMDGVELLRSARELLPDLAVILMTAFGTIETAREAFKLGADDFVQKPFNNDELKLIVRRALDRQALVSENRAFRIAQRKSGSTSNIIGSSPKMQELHHKIAMVAAEESTVLITGESGSGKELVARAIHDLSPRAEKPFIPINCGAMPETLLESELFGFMKGTFTGAVQNRAGMFESADKGSIFLDEIGDMSTAMQVKMLRVLQERRVRRIGASSETAVDTRVIAATNRDIRPTADGGGFRSDLYYRISVIPLAVPALRERREDIPELAEHFVKRFSARSGKKIRLSDEAMHVLNNRPWPGNVRELEHTVERAVAFTENGEQICAAHCADENPLAASAVRLPADGLHLPTHINNIERDLVLEALSRTNNNQTRAAELLQIPVHAIRHLLDKHNLR